MKRQNRLWIICIALVLLCLLGAATVAYGYYSDRSMSKKAVIKKLTDVQYITEDLIRIYNSGYENYEQVLETKAHLGASLLKYVVEEDGGSAVRTYRNGFVVRLAGNRLIVPPDIDLCFTAADFLDATGRPLENGIIDYNSADMAISGDVSDSVGFWRITDDYYFCCTSSDGMNAYMSSQADIQGVLEHMQGVFDGVILCFNESDPNHFVASSDESFAEADNITRDTLGIKSWVGKDVIFNTRVMGTDYIGTFSSPIHFRFAGRASTYRVVFLFPSEQLTYRQFSRLTVVLGVTLQFFAGSIAWTMAAVNPKRRKSGSDKAYSEKRVKQVMVLIGCTGLIVVMLSTMFINALLSLYETTKTSRAAVNVLSTRAASLTSDADRLQKQREDLYAEYGQTVSELLSLYPSLGTRRSFDEVCEIIDADYLMVFSDQGEELFSNSDFVRLVFGTDPDSSTYDFRRLALGVPFIAHDACEDESTGLEKVLIGVPVDDGDISDGYGALIIAVEPEPYTASLTMEDIMRSMTTDDSLSFLLDQETGIITEASDKALIGTNATAQGLSNLDSSPGGILDYFDTNNQHWVGSSAVSEGILYSFVTLAGVVYTHLPLDAAAAGAGFALVYLLLALALLVYYRRSFQKGPEETDTARLLRVPDIADLAAARDMDRLSGMVSSSRSWWTSHTPGQIAWFNASQVLWFEILALLFIRLTHLGKTDFFIFSYVLNGQWEPGLNLFALARIMLLLASTILIMFGLRLFTNLLSNMMNKRGETVVRLIYNLSQYLATIVVLYYGFRYLGFDTDALLASLGFVSLAISLGSKDLVADVLAGISLAFLDLYEIDDYVEIGGFRGWVQEIGVRCTTLINGEGNIKSINNRNVGSVLNLSRTSCHYTASFSLAPGQALEPVEDLLNRELPLIGQRIENIISGPEYKGISSLGPSGTVLNVEVECDSRHFGRVRRNLNRELHLLLEKNQISVK